MHNTVIKKFMECYHDRYILKNFIISDNEQAEIFANAIEVSYQESLQMKKDEEMVMYEELKNPDEIRDFMEEWKLLHE